MITHPLVWRTVPEPEPAIGYSAAVALVERAVVLAESIACRVIAPLACRRALIVSLVANAASAGMGFAYNTPTG